MNALLLSLLLFAGDGGYLVAPPNVATVHTEVRQAPEPGIVHRLTAYSCYSEPCRNSSGVHPVLGTVGVPETGPAAYPLGTVLEIEGLGRMIVVDRCPGCGDGFWLDVYQLTYQDEIQFGSQHRQVRVLKEGE